MKNCSIFGIIINYDDKSKKEEKELFFKVGNNEPTSFTSFIRDIKDVSLEHTLSMYQILNELNDNNKIPELKKLSKEMDLYDYNYKTKDALDKIEKFAKGNNGICLDNLKSEMKLINDKISLELMPRRVNSSKGKENI